MPIIRADHPWDVLIRFTQLAEAFLHCLLVATALHEPIQHVAVLIHGPPQTRTHFIEGKEGLVYVSCIARPRATTVQLMRIRSAKLLAPLADRFVGAHHTTDTEEGFAVPIAEVEVVVQPYPLAHDLGGKTMVCIALGGGWRGHDCLSCLFAHRVGYFAHITGVCMPPWPRVR